MALMFLPLEEVEKQLQQAPLSRQPCIQKRQNEFEVKESVVPTKETDHKESVPRAISPDVRAIRTKSIAGTSALFASKNLQLSRQAGSDGMQ